MNDTRSGTVPAMLVVAAAVFLLGFNGEASMPLKQTKVVTPNTQPVKQAIKEIAGAGKDVAREVLPGTFRSAPNGPFIAANYQDALSLQRNTGKPVVEIVSGPNCGPCLVWKRDVATNPLLRQWLDDNVILVYTDISQLTIRPRAIPAVRITKNGQGAILHQPFFDNNSRRWVNTVPLSAQACKAWLETLVQTP